MSGSHAVYFIHLSPVQVQHTQYTHMHTYTHTTYTHTQTHVYKAKKVIDTEQ